MEGRKCLGLCMRSKMPWIVELRECGHCLIGRGQGGLFNTPLWSVVHYHARRHMVAQVPSCAARWSRSAGSCKSPCHCVVRARIVIAVSQLSCALCSSGSALLRSVDRMHSLARMSQRGVSAQPPRISERAFLKGLPAELISESNFLNWPFWELIQKAVRPQGYQETCSR